MVCTGKHSCEEVQLSQTTSKIKFIGRQVCLESTCKSGKQHPPVKKKSMLICGKQKSKLP